MKNIRDSFQADLDRWLRLAKSLVALEIFGEDQLEKLIKNDPEHKISMGVGTPPPPDRKKVLAKDLLTELQSNHGIVQEIVHGYLIQIWYEFLRKIFEKILEEHFSGQRYYPNAPNIKIGLNFAEDDDSNIISNIQKKASKSFDFIDNDEKMGKIAKSLKTKINQGLQDRIIKHIIVRNVIQHNRGVLRDEDLQKLGCQGGNISLIDDQNKPKQYKQGDRVVISYWEVEALKNDLYEASNQLIP